VDRELNTIWNPTTTRHAQPPIRLYRSRLKSRPDQNA
jgi:hypothetical protein